MSECVIVNYVWLLSSVCGKTCKNFFTPQLKA